MSRHKELLAEFVVCINEARYYDAHEALEAIWFPRRFEDDMEIKLLKGFINAAVSFELVKRGRAASSERVWKNYEKYKVLLGSFESEHNSTYGALAKLIEETRMELI
ncbi:MAG: DUF309 domain-containing protein [Campylobacterales bacterium]|nr:DUF309 domain-containing protein [Campylobacterales bacterium]